MNCAVCEDKSCYSGRDCTNMKKKVLGEYNKKINKDVMSAAASIEAEGYMKLTRIEELLVFCKKMKYEKLGLAFCIGLEDEAKKAHEIFSRDFELSSV
ncbi:MAG: DUF1847 domain-containing protein, partial [Candidatus Altiarchaeales archaeon]|nr:DUF1847 domain-containing protein [Candidatus Altiarchaeales archaeon]